MLIAPEGDTRRRRHAHSACVMVARKRGELPLRDEVARASGTRSGLLARLFGRSEAND